MQARGRGTHAQVAVSFCFTADDGQIDIVFCKRLRDIADVGDVVLLGKCCVTLVYPIWLVGIVCDDGQLKSRMRCDPVGHVCVFDDTQDSGAKTFLGLSVFHQARFPSVIVSRSVSEGCSTV